VPPSLTDASSVAGLEGVDGGATARDGLLFVETHAPVFDEQWSFDFEDRLTRHVHCF
jgi:hypothetical protein